MDFRISWSDLIVGRMLRLLNMLTARAGSHRHLQLVDRVVFCWFALTGIIHFVVEGKLETQLVCLKPKIALQAFATADNITHCLQEQ